MKLSLIGAAIGVAAVVGYVWQDKVNNCPDGERYVSGKPQPTPFHRRFTAWPPKLLAVCSWLAAVFLASSLGGWQAAAVFVTLPGFWFGAVHPTSVDLLTMALAWGASLLWPTCPIGAVFLSLASGVIHERGPVFASVYAWTPWLLVGLLAVQWWAKAAPKPVVTREADRFVGHGSTWAALKAHRGARDIFKWEALLWSMRGVPVAAAYLGTSLAGWCALGLAFASRALGTDPGRFLLWAAPPLLAGMPEIPPWFVAAHVMSFRRYV